MEAVISLKDSSESSTPICIICLKPASKGKKLPNGREQSVQSLKKSAAFRKLKYNPEYRGAINRIDELETSGVRYHSNCYATFTSTAMINRLTDINPNSVSVDVEVFENNNVVSTGQTDLSHTKWNECILCQERKSEHLRQISTESMQQKIRDLAEGDVNLNKRICGTSTDLISVKALYHTNCYNKFSREKMKTANQQVKGRSNKVALKEICSELYIAADKGQVRVLNF